VWARFVPNVPRSGTGGERRKLAVATTAPSRPPSPWPLLEPTAGAGGGRSSFDGVAAWPRARAHAGEIAAPSNFTGAAAWSRADRSTAVEELWSGKRSVSMSAAADPEKSLQHVPAAGGGAPADIRLFQPRRRTEPCLWHAPARQEPASGVWASGGTKGP